MFEIGRAYADQFKLLSEPAGTFSITFINVDGAETVEIVDEGVLATPPKGVNTADKTFTAWPTIRLLMRMPLTLHCIL